MRRGRPSRTTQAELLQIRLLVMDIPESVVRGSEVPGRTHRDFVIPAAIVNRYGPPEVVDD